LLIFVRKLLFLMTAVSQKQCFGVFFAQFWFGFAEVGEGKLDRVPAVLNKCSFCAYVSLLGSTREEQSCLLDLGFVYAPVILLRIFLIKFWAPYLLAVLSCDMAI